MCMNIPLHISGAQHFMFKMQLHTHCAVCLWMAPSGINFTEAPHLNLNSPREEQRVTSHFTLEHLPFPRRERKKLLVCNFNSHARTISRPGCVLYESASMRVTTCAGQRRAQLFGLISRMRSNDQKSNSKSKPQSSIYFKGFSETVMKFNVFMYFQRGLII